LLDIPELNTSIPLTPDEPALAVWINISALDVEELYPPISTRRPPLPAKLVDPDDKTNSPPDPEFPVPTLTYIDPERPPNAVPVPMYRAPELPFVVLPLLSTIIPDTPLLPLFADTISKSPLEPADP
jgi:hypothetical protein